MGKAETTIESMEHMASIVNEVASDISTETQKLLKMVNYIEEKTKSAIQHSEDQMTAWKHEIQNLESEIASYRAMEDEDHDYSAQIAACQHQISILYSRIRKERLRNNDIRQTFSRFRQESSQTLKTAKQVHLAAENANTDGKEYISRKANILSTGYGKIVTGVSTIGMGLGLLSHGSDTDSPSGGHSSFFGGNEVQGAFSITDFGSNKQNAQEWGMQTFQEWNDSLSIVERQAFIDYKKELYPHESSYYVNINDTLRGKDSFRDGNQMRYMRMHNALSRASVPSDVTVYRAVSRSAYHNMIENSRVAGGDGLRDNGFMSCSLVSNNIFTNSSDVIMRLTVTEGSRGAYIGNVGSEFANECELLLDCGSSIFVTETSDVPRSTITGNLADTDTITLVTGVVEA